MSNYFTYSPISDQAQFGTHQLVSEPLDPLIEGIREGSSSHGESGGTTTERGRASSVEDRIISIEETLGTLSGTVLDLSVRLDKFEGKFERMMEEWTRSNRNPEVSNQQSISTPITHYSMAAQSPFPSVQMSHSPVHAHSNHSWSVNPPVLTPVVSVNEQTPVGNLISSPNPRPHAMGSMTSEHEFMLRSLYKEPTADPTREIEARPIRAMKLSVSSVVHVAVQCIVSDLTKLVEGLKNLQDDFMLQLCSVEKSCFIPNAGIGSVLEKTETYKWLTSYEYFSDEPKESPHTRSYYHNILLLPAIKASANVVIDSLADGSQGCTTVEVTPTMGYEVSAPKTQSAYKIWDPGIEV